MKYQRYGLTVERPNCADQGNPVSDDEITRWIKQLLLEINDPPHCCWIGTQSGNAAVHVLKRKVDYAPRFHILVFQGRESFCADLTEEEAAEYLMT